jgi:hypothetical protein
MSFVTPMIMPIAHMVRYSRDSPAVPWMVGIGSPSKSSR